MSFDKMRVLYYWTHAHSKSFIIDYDKHIHLLLKLKGFIETYNNIEIHLVTETLSDYDYALMLCKNS